MRLSLAFIEMTISYSIGLLLFETQSCCVRQVYLKFIILLLQSLKYWDYRYVLPCNALLTSQGCLFICHF